MDSQKERIQIQLLKHPQRNELWELLADHLGSSTRKRADAPIRLKHQPNSTSNKKEIPSGDAPIGPALTNEEQEIVKRGQFSAPAIAKYTAEGIFKRAKRLVDNEKFEEAISLLDEWSCSKGGLEDSSILAFIKAHALRKLNQVTEALVLLELYQEEKKNPWIPFELGLIYRELGRADDAYQCFRKAQSIDRGFNWAEIEATRTIQKYNVPLGRLQEITNTNQSDQLLEVHLDVKVRCGSLLLLIGWCREPLKSGTMTRLSDPLALGFECLGSMTFYHRQDVCQSLGLPENQCHGFASLLNFSTFERWSELGEFRLHLETKTNAKSLPTTASICLAKVPNEEKIENFLKSAMGVFRVSIDSGNRWTDSLKMFSPKAILEVSSLFARHVEQECKQAHVHWITQIPMKTKPIATIVFVQLGSFLSAKPAILQLVMSGLQLEIIIVNNSTELFSETFHILDRFSEIAPNLKFAIINQNKNLGFSAGCNLGAQHANGECLVFHNNDLYANSENDYKVLISRALHEPNAIHSAYQYFTDGTLMQQGLTATRISTAEICEIPLYNGFSVGRNQMQGEILACSGSLMAISTPLFKHIGGFSEDFVYAHFEDFDLCLRARQEGIPLKIWEDIKFYHAEGTGSTAPYHLTGTTSHINRMLFSLKWHTVLENMDLSVEYSL